MYDFFFILYNNMMIFADHRPPGERWSWPDPGLIGCSSPAFHPGAGLIQEGSSEAKLTIDITAGLTGMCGSPNCFSGN